LSTAYASPYRSLMPSPMTSIQTPVQISHWHATRPENLPAPAFCEIQSTSPTARMCKIGGCTGPYAQAVPKRMRLRSLMVCARKVRQSESLHSSGYLRSPASVNAAALTDQSERQGCRHGSTCGRIRVWCNCTLVLCAAAPCCMPAEHCDG
jgi:hypothetical protein